MKGISNEGYPPQHRNYFAECLNQKRIRSTLEMVVSHEESEGTKTVLDAGCDDGAFSLVLSKVFQTVGVTLQKECLRSHAQRENERLDFVIADIYNLPFKKASFDVIVCASALQCLPELDSALAKFKSILKTNGVLFASYPIETALYKMIWRIVSPQSFKNIDQTQTQFYNSSTRKMEAYGKNPLTHKQTYLSIRENLYRHFRLVKRVKLPFKFLPDYTSYYECVKMVNYQLDFVKSTM